MIKSMTGYGRAQASLHLREITVEIRSVNHRYFDCSVRIPRAYNFLEDVIKNRLQGKISRGKVDVFITIDASKVDNISVELNEPLLKGYVEAAKILSETYDMTNDLTVSTAMRLPDIINVSKMQEDTDELSSDVASILNDALDGYMEMSVAEGARLANDVFLRLNIIEKLVFEVEQRSPKCVEDYRVKLEARLREFLDSVTLEPQRILTEVAIFADKIAVTEETVRLRSHLKQLGDMLKSGGSIGRKLDFLVQELNREANTIGSKANDVEMAQLVVDIKAEIEKIREQIQNIE